jgi:hypothetical protein
MNYEKFNPHYHKPAKFTGEAYGVKTSVEHDHSDLDIDQLMDAFETIAIGLGYHTNSWKQWILDRAEEYIETDAEDLKEKLEEYTLEDFKREEAEFNLRHQYESREELENDFFGNYDSESERRMDIIGQNGNDGLHYRATEEDEDEFDDYGKRIEKDRVSFEWGDEPEDEDLDFPEPNEELKDGYKKYKKALKTLSAKQKKKSK